MRNVHGWCSIVDCIVKSRQQNLVWTIWPQFIACLLTMISRSNQRVSTVLVSVTVCSFRHNRSSVSRYYRRYQRCYNAKGTEDRLKCSTCYHIEQEVADTLSEIRLTDVNRCSPFPHFLKSFISSNCVQIGALGRRSFVSFSAPESQSYLY